MAQGNLVSSRGFAAPILMAFLVVMGVGVATSYFADPPRATGSGKAQHRVGSDGEMLARLKDYAGSKATDEPAPAVAGGKMLPDVETMIERLVARLETAPEDVKGWRTLGWSYFNTGRYEQAAAAYGRAVKLDPQSAELRLAYEQAKAKLASLQVAQDAKPQAALPNEQDSAIRAMVDGLAARLEGSPRDVEGWARLMRSRVVLGETEVAATAYRKALEVFADDAAATGKLTAAAVELGLKAR